jgi:hypothetical protein
VLGNQEIPDYAYAAGIERNRNYLLGNQINRGATQLSLANPNIKWQGNASTNVGLDLAMLDDRLNVTADVYRSESNDVLYDAPLPLSFGAVGNPFVNAGNIRNSGFELGVGHRFERGGFQLNTNATFTTTRNKVLSLATGEQPIFDPTGVARTAVGGSVGEFYVRKTAGVFQSEAEIQSHTTTLANGEVRVLQPDAEPGDQRFVDVNRDGLINDDDRYNAGSAVPDFTYGLFLDAKFRRFDVGLNLRGSQGNEAFNDVRYWTDRGDEPGNFRRGYSPWTPENPSTTTPRIAAGSPPVYLSDRWVEDASFLRIQNIVLGYTLPEGLLSRAGLGVGGAPRIYFNVQNAFTFTDYSNWDPETLGAGHPLGRGIDAGAIFPNVRTVTFGLDLRL